MSEPDPDPIRADRRDRYCYVLDSATRGVSVQPVLHRLARLTGSVLRQLQSKTTDKSGLLCSVSPGRRAACPVTVF